MANNDYARLETRHDEPVLLEGVVVSGDLRGLLFGATVEQRFRNPTEQSIEIAYTFPLPYGAVLLDIQIQLGEQHLKGSIVPKSEAETTYIDAITDGNAAIMLEQNRDGSYTLNLGNLAADEACIIRFRYAQTLSFEQAGVRLLVPTVIAPRYGNPILDGSLEPHQTPEYSLMQEHPFNIEINIHGDLAKARVLSPSHPIGFSQSHSVNEDQVKITLARQGSLDRDFVLVLDQLSVNSLAVMAKDSVDGDKIVSLLSVCPHVPNEGSHPVSVKILVDGSGSMAGDSIAAAKRALHSIVSSFEPGDRFSLSKFGNRVFHRSKGLWSIKDSTLLAASKWIGELDAELGGTEMESALSGTFNIERSTPSEVLLITDGEIFEIDRVIKTAKTSGHRIFAVGIGSSSAEGNLRRLAEATGGAADFVAPGEAVEPAILRMFTRLRSPQLSHLSFEWSEGVTPLWVSPLPLSVFDGDTVSVFAEFKEPPKGAVSLVGEKVTDGSRQTLTTIRFTDSILKEDTLPRMAANLRMQNTDNERVQKRIAVQYQLITAHTNFLMVHERQEDEKALEIPDLHKISQMVPAGWAGNGSVADDGPSLMHMACYSLDFSTSQASLKSVRNMSSSEDIDYMDIPAFLRRSTEDDEVIPKICTPLELSEWLRSHDKSEWPVHYPELSEKHIELNITIFGWLNHLEDFEDDEPRTAERVLAAFLNYMALDSTYERLVHPASLLQKAGQALKALTKGSENSSMPSFANGDTSLEQMIEAELETLLPSEWPERIKTMAENLTGMEA